MDIPFKDKLYAAVVPCAHVEDLPEAKFLPQSFVDQVITKEVITAHLSFTAWLYSHVSDSLPNLIHEQARKVFAVLGLIGQMSAIENLIYKDGINDKDLPLDRLVGAGASSNILVSRNTGKELRSFQSWVPAQVEAFLETQWCVLAPALDATSTDLTLDPRCPIPIVGRTVLKSQDDSARIYQAALHPEHRFTSSANVGTLVAIKEIRQAGDFAREKDILKNIDRLGNQHLIKLLASCEKGPFRCFIFPWPEGGTLWDHWRREGKSPKTNSLVLWWLEQVVGLSGAIRALCEYNINHSRIDPHNIFHFLPANGEHSGGRGTLVLAATGFPKQLQNSTDLYVASEYEAPDTQFDFERTTRRDDMWSTGCLLLETVVWLLYGFDAVKVFRARRVSHKGDPNSMPGTFFQRRKGVAKIHPVVRKTFEVLYKDPRCGNGTALSDLLSLVEGHLLRITPEDRHEPANLHERLREMTLKAQKDSSSYLRPDLVVWYETPRFFVRKSRMSSDSSYSSASSTSTSKSGQSLQSWDSRESMSSVKSQESWLSYEREENRQNLAPPPKSTGSNDNHRGASHQSSEGICASNSAPKGTPSENATVDSGGHIGVHIEDDPEPSIQTLYDVVAEFWSTILSNSEGDMSSSTLRVGDPLPVLGKVPSATATLLAPALETTETEISTEDSSAMEVFRTAISKLDRCAAQTLLETRFQDVSKDEYSWLTELRLLGPA